MKTLFQCTLAAALLINISATSAQPTAKPPILIGQTYVKTGPVSVLSFEPIIGIKAMLHSVNSTGGIRGQLIELQQADDGFDAIKAGENVKKLMQSGAVAILMPIGTTSAEGAIKAANESMIPLVGAYSGAESVAKFSEYAFPVRISADQEYDRIVQHLFTIGQTRIAFAYNDDNPGAKAGMESTKKAIEIRGQKLLGSVSVKQDGSDATPKAQTLAALKPSAIIMALTNPLSAKFIPAYKATGAESRLYSSSFLNGRMLAQSIGKDAAGLVVSQVVPYPWASTLPVVSEYADAMKKAGQPDLSYASFEGYLATKILVEALKRSGDSPTPAKVKRALESFTEVNLGGIFVRYSTKEHAGIGYSSLSMLRENGSFLK
ncbi:MAG: ABC transporter substrate-binding protein [Polaromonas sp.]|uniref:ABC transporter substrate-binding protein n=1 Tax=Polaromonas sp. TaxID=1869339 RepID=UPI0025F8FDD7|nr:ABC transporter substrate-binding protein [Polaromonas sp.]MBI2726533.1 ABC transporter substrate-binding protein [Polaromonas sp.]